jgi:hypothetical protein
MLHNDRAAGAGTKNVFVVWGKQPRGMIIFINVQFFGRGRRIK